MALKNKIEIMILGIAALLTFIGIYLAFLYAPTHPLMGDVQRIFYFHVASAWVSYLAFGVTLIGSLLYLKTKTMKFFEDNLDPANFIRIHRSHIVRIDKIKNIELLEKESYRLTLANGSSCPVSKSGYAKLKEILN